jgi:hypothetical protein
LRVSFCSWARLIIIISGFMPCLGPRRRRRRRGGGGGGLMRERRGGFY